MPEGHTLHRLANDVWDAFGGRLVQASSPQGRFVDGAALLNGHVLRQTEAHGKHFLADFEGAGWLHIHLGLIGKMDIHPAPVPEPVGQVRLRLQSATSYADLRGATGGHDGPALRPGGRCVVPARARRCSSWCEEDNGTARSAHQFATQLMGFSSCG
jgi:hypothetical protein